MRKLEEVKSNNSSGISLVKLSGKKIKDIIGYISTEFGDPTFVISNVIYDDESSSFAGGEHDWPFLGTIPNTTDEELQYLYDQEMY